MHNNDSAAPASATGILNCLKLLAQEAASLNLTRTLTAIEDALEMAASESGAESINVKRFELPRPMVH